MSEPTPPKPLSVAIVGGGLTGLAMTIGLLSRGIHVRLYERTGRFATVNEDIGITPNAERAMKIVDPRIYETFKRLALPNEWDWFQCVNGEDPSSNLSEGFKIYLGKASFGRCAQDNLLDKLALLIPPDTIKLAKELVSLSEHPEDRTLLEFQDGTSELADIVIGCDGIRSQVRWCLLGETMESMAHYSHKYEFRGLVDLEEASKELDKASEGLGEEVTSTRLTHLGTSAHVLTFPLAAGPRRSLNVVGYVTDTDEWRRGHRTEWIETRTILKAFVRFGPAVRTILHLLPGGVQRRALFDNSTYPAPAYARGRVALAGDAAHAAAPYQGAGPGLALEDAVALCTLLAKADKTVRDSGPLSRAEVLQRTLGAYSDVRRARCERVMHGSRCVGDVYEGQTDAGRNPVKCHDIVYNAAHYIWDYDVDGLVRDCEKEYHDRVGFWVDVID